MECVTCGTIFTASSKRQKQCQPCLGFRSPATEAGFNMRANHRIKADGLNQAFPKNIYTVSPHSVTEKTCRSCGRAIHQKEGELGLTWSRRGYCDRICLRHAVPKYDAKSTPPRNPQNDYFIERAIQLTNKMPKRGRR